MTGQTDSGDRSDSATSDGGPDTRACLANDRAFSGSLLASGSDRRGHRQHWSDEAS